MQEDLKLWLSISNLSNVPHSLLLIARVYDFNSGMFKIDENEHEEEVLRRDRESLYQLESMRAFEKAFGIDRLEKIIQDVKKKRDVSIHLDLDTVVFRKLRTIRMRIGWSSRKSTLKNRWSPLMNFRHVILLLRRGFLKHT